VSLFAEYIRACDGRFFVPARHGAVRFALHVSSLFAVRDVSASVMRAASSRAPDHSDKRFPDRCLRCKWM
jgi:hypothetical protein